MAALYSLSCFYVFPTKSYQLSPLATEQLMLSAHWPGLEKVNWINLQSELVQLIWSKADKGALTWIQMTELWVQWHLTNRWAGRDGVIIPAVLETRKNILNWAWASKTYHVYTCLFKNQANPNTVKQQNRCFYSSHFFKRLSS